MSTYTISPCLLNDASQREISKILLKFLTEDRLKVALDKGKRAVVKYNEVILGRNEAMLAEWLRYITDMHCYVSIGIGNVADKELFLEICSKTFDRNLLVYDKHTFAGYARVSVNSISYNGIEINIHDVGEAIEILSSNRNIIIGHVTDSNFTENGDIRQK